MCTENSQEIENTYLDGIKLSTHTAISSIVRTHQDWLLFTSVSFYEISSRILLILKIWLTRALDHAQDGLWRGDASLGSRSCQAVLAIVIMWTDWATWALYGSICTSNPWSRSSRIISWLVALVSAICLCIRIATSSQATCSLSAHCFLHRPIALNYFSWWFLILCRFSLSIKIL